MARVAALLGLTLCLWLPAAVYGEVPTTQERFVSGASELVLTAKPLSISEQSRLALIRPRAVQPGKRDTVVNGIVLGAAAGAGYGAFVFAKTHHDLDPGQKVWLMPMSAGIGAGVGWLIDYLSR